MALPDYHDSFRILSLFRNSILRLTLERYGVMRNPWPVIKSVKSHTIDDNPEAKLLPLKNSSEYRLEIVHSKLPDEVFGLKQFDLEERTQQDYERDIELRKQKELKEQNTFAPTPAGGFPLAAQPFAISPWFILSSVGVLFVLIGLFLFRYGKKATNPRKS